MVTDSAQAGNVGGADLETYKSGPIEEWRTVAGWPAYEVSSLGRVRRGLRVLAGWRQQGYPFVNLSCGRVTKKQAVHRLVALAFLGDRPAGRQASHLNGDRADCRAVNLKWETPRDNNNRKREHGTWQAGAAHGSARLSPMAVEIIRAAPPGYGTGRALARRFGVSETHVSAIRNGGAWANG